MRYEPHLPGKARCSKASRFSVTKYGMPKSRRHHYIQPLTSKSPNIRNPTNKRCTKYSRIRPNGRPAIGFKRATLQFIHPSTAINVEPSQC